MLLIILSLICIATSLAGIFLIVGKHLHVVASIDIESLPAERNAVVKDKIIVDRIKRKISSFGTVLAILSEPLQNLLIVLQKKIRSFHGLLLRIQDRHKKLLSVGGSSITSTSFSKLNEDDKVAFLVHEAEKLVEQEQLSSAEQKYIDAIGINAHCVSCYKGLLSVYTLQKDWEHACEIAEYACKLLHERLKKNESGEPTCDVSAEYAESLHDLSDIYCQLGRFAESLSCVKKAVKVQPNNPKYLNALVDSHVLLKERLKAERALDLLKKANPENQKLSELEERIAELAY